MLSYTVDASEATSDLLTQLQKALKRYEEIPGREPFDLPSVTLFSDGTGYFSTNEAGRIFDFKDVTGAIAWLNSAAQKAKEVKDDGGT